MGRLSNAQETRFKGPAADLQLGRAQWKWVWGREGGKGAEKGDKRNWEEWGNESDKDK